MRQLPSFETYDGHFIMPYLAVGARPGHEGEPAQHAQEIAAAGIRGVLHVSSYGGRPAIQYVAHLPETVEWRQVGFWDGYLKHGESVREPLSPAYARLLVHQAAIMLRDHGPLLVHCMGGRGRSGNTAAIVLAAREGIPIDKAITIIRTMRPCCSALNHQGFWRNVDLDELVALAATVLAEPTTDPEVFCERVRGDASEAKAG